MFYSPQPSYYQIEYTNRILNSIQRGLFLEVQETGIYAWRQDRCHVFASTSDPSLANAEPAKLPQNTMVELLNFEKFVNGRCRCLLIYICVYTPYTAEVCL